MSLFLASPTLWHQILLAISIGIVALPLLCLFLGVLVCLLEPSATRTFENQRWPQALMSLCILGGFVALALAGIGVLTWLFQVGIDLIYPNDWGGDIAFVLSLFVVLGTIYYCLEWQAIKNSPKNPAGPQPTEEESPTPHPNDKTMLPQFPSLQADWQAELARHNRAIIFCWAEWSPNDFRFAPVLARVVPDLKDCAFFTADLDEETLVPFFHEAGVTTNPYLVLWQNGTTVERFIGHTSEENLRENFKSWGVL